MQIAMIGSGSWATALTKILTDNQLAINWWIRNQQAINHIQSRHHNPQYLSSAYFDTKYLNMSTDILAAIQQSDVIVLNVPSAYIIEALTGLPSNCFEGKEVISAVKGILPSTNQLLNDYLQEQFQVALKNYYTILGPCHAEEVASEKLSYLTVSGLNESRAEELAQLFETPYIKTRVNHDIIGVQYAAVLKNVYALGAGIAHGLEYGDNFLSVYIANAANEMATFLKGAMALNTEREEMHLNVNYAASVYLGDLLVTCYSLYSRNRMFGNMIGKGYSVKAAQLELNMVAEGYNASKCIHLTSKELGIDLPIASTIYQILWNNVTAEQGFARIEQILC